MNHCFIDYWHLVSFLKNQFPIFVKCNKSCSSFSSFHIFKRKNMAPNETITNNTKENEENVEIDNNTLIFFVNGK